MRMILLSLVLILATNQTEAAQPDDGRIVSRAVHTFPSWDKAVEATDVEKYATTDEYAAAISDSRFVLEKIRYRSEGLDVVAYLYRPASPAAGKKYPAIVFNRGSYVRGEITAELVPMFRRLALEGFVVIAPLYRQSEGTEGRDEMGGADLSDLMSVVPLASSLQMIDTSSLFLYGESRGGMMVFQAIRDGFPAKAAATFGAFADLEEMVSTEAGRGMANHIWPDFAERSSQIIARRSAVQWPEKLNIPLLLMHGSDDGSVSVNQSLRLATALASLDRDFGLIVYPGGRHTLREFDDERDRAAVDFFRRYLK